MTFPESLFKTFDAPPGFEVEVQKFRFIGQDRGEWVVAATFELPNGIQTFEQVSIPASEMDSSADQDEVGMEAWRRMRDRVVAWVDRNEEAEDIEGESFEA